MRRLELGALPAITHVEQVERMADPQPLPLIARLAGDLQQTAGVGRDYRLSPRGENVRQLAAAQLAGHFRLGDVVRSRRPTTDLGFWQWTEREAGNLL